MTGKVWYLIIDEVKVEDYYNTSIVEKFEMEQFSFYSTYNYYDSFIDQQIY